MKLPLRMAWRYLFAKKSTNAINIITLTAAFGVAIGAAALVLALSVFNGFEDLFMGMFNNLNPDVEISVKDGKTFTVSDELKTRLWNVNGVAQIAETLEETAFFTYRGKRSAGKIKGVDDSYVGINRIDTSIREGFYQLRDGEQYFSIVGRQLASSLSIDVLDAFQPLSIYMAKRERTSSSIFGGGGSPLVVRQVFPVGIINSQEAFENQAVLLDIQLARRLLGLEGRVVSSLELKLHPGFATEGTYRDIREAMGTDYIVKNRLEQESGILKLMKIEKWISFAIVALMMVLISFNLIGALWMIVLEKKKDIAILRSMGMTSTNIRDIFLRVGLFLCTLGLLGGFLLAFGFYLLQRNYSLIRLPGGMLEAYPISLRWSDFPIVAVVVLLIGFLASILPALRAQRVEAIVREE